MIAINQKYAWYQEQTPNRLIYVAPQSVARHYVHLSDIDRTLIP